MITFSKLETIAAALAVPFHPGDDLKNVNVQDVTSINFMEVARAAVKAMRECTDEMIEIGWQDGQAGWGEGEDIKPVWTSICDAILKGKV